MCPKSNRAAHGVVTELSPVKVSKRNSSVRYFDSKMSDGHKSVRVVSFDPSLRSAHVPCSRAFLSSAASAAILFRRRVLISCSRASEVSAACLSRAEARILRTLLSVGH